MTIEHLGQLMKDNKCGFSMFISGGKYHCEVTQYGDVPVGYGTGETVMLAVYSALEDRCRKRGELWSFDGHGFGD